MQRTLSYFRIVTSCFARIAKFLFPDQGYFSGSGIKKFLFFSKLLNLHTNTHTHANTILSLFLSFSTPLSLFHFLFFFFILLSNLLSFFLSLSHSSFSHYSAFSSSSLSLFFPSHIRFWALLLPPYCQYYFTNCVKKKLY